MKKSGKKPAKRFPRQPGRPLAEK